GHTEFVTRLDFAADGRSLASMSSDGTVRLWETATGRERASFRGHEGRVKAGALSPDGRLLASGGADSTAILWDATGRSGAKARTDTNAIWADLAADAPLAHRATWDLTD